MTEATPGVRREIQAMGLVGFAHFLSHFYFLTLPPLFVMIKPELGVSYAELGLVVAISSVGVGVLQTPCGFLVDRIGARRVLIGGLALVSAMVALAGVVSGYGALLFVWFMAGVGNSVFHPADYALLASSVDEKRLGRAFDWRSALVIVGLVGIGLAGIIALFGGPLREAAPADRKKAASGGGRGGIRLLMSRRMMLFFLFFMSTSAAGAGINSFAVVALVQLHGVDLVAAGQGLTFYLVTTAIGVLVGGVLADRGKAHDRIVMIGFALAATGFWLVGLEGLPFGLGIAAFTFAGFMRGIINPSRDVMVRNATPPDSVGKVFAFVTTGYTISGGLIPPLFGWLMDVGAPSWTFWTCAMFSVFGIFVLLLQRGSARGLD